MERAALHLAGVGVCAVVAWLELWLAILVDETVVLVAQRLGVRQRQLVAETVGDVHLGARRNHVLVRAATRRGLRRRRRRSRSRGRGLCVSAMLSMSSDTLTVRTPLFLHDLGQRANLAVRLRIVKLECCTMSDEERSQICVILEKQAMHVLQMSIALDQRAVHLCSTQMLLFVEMRDIRTKVTFCERSFSKRPFEDGTDDLSVAMATLASLRRDFCNLRQRVLTLPRVDNDEARYWRSCCLNSLACITMFVTNPFVLQQIARDERLKLGDDTDKTSRLPLSQRFLAARGRIDTSATHVCPDARG